MIGHVDNGRRLDTSRSYSVLTALTFPLPPSSFLNDLGLAGATSDMAHPKAEQETA